MLFVEMWPRYRDGKHCVGADADSRDGALPSDVVLVRIVPGRDSCTLCVREEWDVSWDSVLLRLGGSV